MPRMTLDQFVERRDPLCDNAQGRIRSIRVVPGELSYGFSRDDSTQSSTKSIADYRDGRNVLSIGEKAISMDADKFAFWLWFVAWYAPTVEDNLDGAMQFWRDLQSNKQAATPVANATPDQMYYAAVAVLKPVLLEAV